MNLVKLIEYLRDRLKTVVWCCLGVLVLLALVDALFVSKEHAHTRIEHFPAFWSVFGFLACALIVILSKWYGQAGIMTREDYYEQGETKEQEEAHRHE
jgi:hypothetical protein